MVVIKSKVLKKGNSFSFSVPKALLDTEVLDQENVYIWELKGIAGTHTKGPLCSLFLGDPAGIPA